MPGSISFAVPTTNISLAGASSSAGSLTLTQDSPTGAFADFGFARGLGSIDPFISQLISQSVDASNSSSWVRLSTTATAPTSYAPYAPQNTIAGRAAYAGILVQEVGMKASGSAFVDHVQFEQSPARALLSADAEGYDAGMLYSLEPGVGALWELSQAHTFTGRFAGHFLASPAYNGNTYARVATSYSTYNQLLIANRSYADVLNGPS